MTTSGAVDLPLQVFGSYCPELPPASLPPGLSPWTQDSEFIRGGVKTRPGLFQQFQLPGNPTINYLKSYINPSLVLRMLALDSLGNVYKETPLGTLNTVIGTVVPGSFGKSTTCFGREYMAFGDGINGIDIPRQYDDTNFDRVSQVGPGLAPSAADENNPSTIVASPVGALQSDLNGTIIASPGGLSEIGNVVTVKMSFSQDLDILQPGDQVIIAGAGVAGYNGTFTVLTPVDSNNTFTYYNPTTGLAASGNGTVKTQLALINLTAAAFIPVGSSVTIAGVGVAGYNGTWLIRKHVGASATSAFFFAVLNVGGLADSGNGTVNVVGNIAAGKHQISVVFVTRQNYITAPAAPLSWTAGGTKRTVVTNIPTGPYNVIARILVFTAAGGSNFFYTGPQSPIPGGSMIISDNTTTTVTVDFTDAVLLSGINADALFNLVELGECSGVIDYADRMFWWGERNKVNNFVNLSFDGSSSNYVTPLGWALDPVNGAGGNMQNALNGHAVWGSSYAIAGDGATALRGMITQSAFQDLRGVPILLPNTAYSVRVRLNQIGGVAATQGNLVIEIFSASGGSLGLFSVPIAGVPVGSFKEYIGALMVSQSTIPSDAVLRVYTNGTLNNGSQVAIDNIEPYPTSQPFNLTQVRASYNVAANANLGPESFDGVTGLLSPQPFDGQGIRCMFKLREFLYIVKERSLYVTQDDGVNEPSNWSIKQVSLSVGTPSVNGVAVGEDWAVIANRKGLYMFNGGEPQKISQEIQSNQTDIALKFFWDNGNWAKGQFLWTTVDEQNKRIFVGLPFGADAAPTGVFYLDYRPLGSSEDIINGAPIHTSYSGRVINYEHARKWNPWNITANCAAVIERGDGTGQVFIGSGLANGQIWSLSESQLFDNIGGVSTAINGFYVPYGFPSHDEEEGLQLGSHKKDYTYLTAYVTGAGLCTLNFYPENPAVTAQQLTAWNLSAATARDREQQLGGNVSAERGFFQFGTNAVGAFYKMQKFVPSLKPSVIPLRGVS